MLQALTQRTSQSSPKVESNDDSVSRVHVWAIASNGDALYRYCCFLVFVLRLFFIIAEWLNWNFWILISYSFLRNGVSARCPEGDEWIHVKSDAQFQSISIGRDAGSGGCIKVWAVSKDGVAYLRHGVSDQLPTGLNEKFISLWLLSSDIQFE